MTVKSVQSKKLRQCAVSKLSWWLAELLPFFAGILGVLLFILVDAKQLDFIDCVKSMNIVGYSAWVEAFTFHGCLLSVFTYLSLHVAAILWAIAFLLIVCNMLEFSSMVKAFKHYGLAHFLCIKVKVGILQNVRNCISEGKLES